MERILVEVYVPITESAYDIFIPLHSQLYDVSALVKKAISDLSNGQFVSNESTALCFRETGSILDVSKTAFELNIQNGSKLMLI